MPKIYGAYRLLLMVGFHTDFLCMSWDMDTRLLLVHLLGCQRIREEKEGSLLRRSRPWGHSSRLQSTERASTLHHSPLCPLRPAVRFCLPLWSDLICALEGFRIDLEDSTTQRNTTKE